MATAGAGGGDGVCLLSFVDGRDLRRRGDAEAFDMRTFPTRSEARAGNTDGAVERRLISHLSKTARVDAHCNLRGRTEMLYSLEAGEDKYFPQDDLCTADA